MLAYLPKTRLGEKIGIEEELLTRRGAKWSEVKFLVIKLIIISQRVDKDCEQETRMTTSAARDFDKTEICVLALTSIKHKTPPASCISARSQR